MLYDLEAFKAQFHRTYSADDITVVVAVRLHAGNPWIIARIEALHGYYQPAPRILVVDFGSQAEFAERLAAACGRAQLELLRVEDQGTFSLAMARNRGAAHAQTELLFFSDVDCFGERDLFGRLADFANGISLGACFDQVGNLPVYHLGAEASERFMAAETAQARNADLTRSLHASVYAAPDKVAEYVDPHSNFFLVRRDFYDYIGGYNESFRGHGSEDFEFFLRLAMYSLQFPRPRDIMEDAYGPLTAEHEGAKPYRGFRRLFELMAVPAQLAGLRIAHLHHERRSDASDWYEKRDVARSRFSEQVLPLLQSRAHLLDYDWMPRSKRALVLIRQETHADVFFPLRFAGYALTSVLADDEQGLARARALLDGGEIDAVAILNPYMKSHAGLRPLFERAKQLGVSTIVFERGALPESWYYGPDMSYADPDYASLVLSASDFTAYELEVTDRYAERLRSGQATLEANGGYAETIAQLASMPKRYAQTCLIPLQLHDDVAVTQFNEGFSSYEDFVNALPKAVAKHPDVLFLIKPHPLSKRPLGTLPPNVFLCDQGENIHALIDLSDSVVCYNSGVGLLALVHEKKLVTVGNAFYNLRGFGLRATSSEQAFELAIRAPAQSFHTRPIRLFLAWLLWRKYSFFRGESVIRESAQRKIHEFRNLLWYRLSLGAGASARRAALDAPVSKSSYATTLMGVGREISPRSFIWMETGELTRRVASPYAGRKNIIGKTQKLIREPKRFLEESRQPVLRRLGAVIPRELGSDSAARVVGTLLRDPKTGLVDVKRMAEEWWRTPGAGAHPHGLSVGLPRRTSPAGSHAGASSAGLPHGARRDAPPGEGARWPEQGAGAARARLVSPERKAGADYALTDLTLVVSVRMHGANPWLPERLRLLRAHYAPLPSVLIVDFGSETPFRENLEAICREEGFRYAYVDDRGLYSASIARNAGVQLAETSLVFLNDVDCLGSRDLFARLLAHANAIRLGVEFDQVVSLPVYHLGEVATDGIGRCVDADSRGAALEAYLSTAVIEERGRTVEFVAPYSNCVLLRRDFFELLGGYDPSFRGHGSEDFEFLLRAALVSEVFPEPEDVLADLASPHRAEFYGPRAYRGFRRLLELMSFRAETAGLRMAHLHHARGGEADPWFSRNDWGRTNFNARVSDYLQMRARLLNHDGLAREKCAWVVCEVDEYRRFLPLRLAGYRLQHVESQADAEALLDREHARYAVPDLIATSTRSQRLSPWIQPFLSGREHLVVDRPEQLLPPGMCWTSAVRRYSQASYAGGRLSLPRPGAAHGAE